MSNRLYVTNLSSNTTELELSELFATVGRVLSLRLVTDPRSPAKNRFGFVEMETPEMTQAAMDEINHYVLHERKIKLTELGKPVDLRTPTQQADASKSRRREVHKHVRYVGSGGTKPKSS
jgi:RNA recognition motif-containing protein